VDNDALPPGHELDLAIADLRWLAAHGASSGVYEIIRERRRQVEKLDYTPEHDGRVHANGMLLHMARHRLVLVDVARDELTATPVSDEDGLRKGGALVAAELDRLTGTSP
jgi:hypothetical protein